VGPMRVGKYGNLLQSPDEIRLKSRRDGCGNIACNGPISAVYATSSSCYFRHHLLLHLLRHCVMHRTLHRYCKSVWRYQNRHVASSRYFDINCQRSITSAVRSVKNYRPARWSRSSGYGRIARPRPAVIITQRAPLCATETNLHRL